MAGGKSSILLSEVKFHVAINKSYENLKLFLILKRMILLNLKKNVIVYM
jgi:hypothetical protein